MLNDLLMICYGANFETRGWQMRRREFIAGLGSAAVWPMGAQAQQREERVRRAAALMAWAETDSRYRAWFNIFVHRLSQLGWVDGQNVRIDQRWANGDVDRMRSFKGVGRTSA
jgi:putative ABC transport system substrate-binding protein